MKEWWTLSKIISASIAMIVWFLSLLFALLVLWICVYWTFLVFLIVVCECILQFNLQVFYWEFLHLYSLERLADNFLFLSEFCLVLVSGWSQLQRTSLQVFLPFLFPFPMLSVLEGLVEFGAESIWACLLLAGKFLITASIST